MIDLNEDSKDEIVDTLLMRKESYRAKDEDIRWRDEVVKLKPFPTASETSTGTTASTGLISYPSLLIFMQNHLVFVYSSYNRHSS